MGRDGLVAWEEGAVIPVAGDEGVGCVAVGANYGCGLER